MKVTIPSIALFPMILAAIALSGCLADRGPGQPPSIAGEQVEVTLLQAPLPDRWRVRTLSAGRNGWLVTTAVEAPNEPTGFRVFFFRDRRLTVLAGVHAAGSGQAVEDAIYLPRLQRVVFATQLEVAQWDPAEPGAPGQQAWPKARLGLEVGRPALTPLGEQSVLLHAGDAWYRFNARSGRADAIHPPSGTVEMIDAGNGRWLVSRSTGDGTFEPGLYLFLESTGEARPIATDGQYRHVRLTSGGQTILAERLDEATGGTSLAVRMDWRGQTITQLSPPSGDDNPKPADWHVHSFSPDGQHVAWQGGGDSNDRSLTSLLVTDTNGRSVYRSADGKVAAAAWSPDTTTLFAITREGDGDMLNVVRISD